MPKPSVYPRPAKVSPRQGLCWAVNLPISGPDSARAPPLPGGLDFPGGKMEDGKWKMEDGKDGAIHGIMFPLLMVVGRTEEDVCGVVRCCMVMV